MSPDTTDLWNGHVCGIDEMSGRSPGHLLLMGGVVGEAEEMGGHGVTHAGNGHILLRLDGLHRGCKETPNHAQLFTNVYGYNIHCFVENLIQATLQTDYLASSSKMFMDTL